MAAQVTSRSRLVRTGTSRHISTGPSTRWTRSACRSTSACTRSGASSGKSPPIFLWQTQWRNDPRHFIYNWCIILDVFWIDVCIAAVVLYIQSWAQGNEMRARLAYYVGGIDSLLKPKLTNRLKSWKTSLLVVPSLGGVSVPVTGVAAPGGDARAAKIPSPAVNAPPLLA